METSTIAVFVNVVLGVALAYIVSVACYRLCFHHLADHSGPWFARLSSIPNWYHATKGDRHEWIFELHCRYGPAVRFEPNSISFNTALAADEIYKSRKSNVIKSEWYQGVQDSAGGFQSTFTAREKARHAVKRRLLSHAFSEQALKGYEPRIRKLTGTWLDSLEVEASKSGGRVNVGDWCSYLILDILGDLAYGSSFGLSTEPKDRWIPALIPRATGGWYTLGYHPLTRLWRFLLFKTRLGGLLGGKSYHDNIQFRSLCVEKVHERRLKKANGSGDGHDNGIDMFEHLLNGRDPQTGEGYSIGDLACESVLLMVAGSQSTAGGLAAAIFYLAHHPAKLSKLRAEIHQAFTSEDAITYEPQSPLALLPYLRACINETLRLSPPTPGHLPREISGEQGLRINGRWYRAKTIVGVSPYAIHRNMLYFDDPFSFMPERWLESEHLKRIESGFIPFSGGVTGCIGQKLAMMEMCLVLARLLWRFNLVVQPDGGESPTEYRMKDRFVGEGSGPHLLLIPRPL